MVQNATTRVLVWRGEVGEMPEWVQTIRDIAIVGGHMIATPNLPPTYIVWFDTTEEYHLLAFVGDFRRLCQRNTFTTGEQYENQ